LVSGLKKEREYVRGKDGKRQNGYPRAPAVGEKEAKEGKEGQNIEAAG